MSIAKIPVLMKRELTYYICAIFLIPANKIISSNHACRIDVDCLFTTGAPATAPAAPSEQEDAALPVTLTMSEDFRTVTIAEIRKIKRKSV